MQAESTRGDIRLCQRRRAKHAQGCGRCSPYLAWVVLYPTGGSDLPDAGATGKPVSRQTAPHGNAKRMARTLKGEWGTSGEGKTRNPF